VLAAGSPTVAPAGSPPALLPKGVVAVPPVSNQHSMARFPALIDTMKEGMLGKIVD
jgi:hypothetical protein